MVKDFLGQEVKPGDYFAYPLTIGRSAQMAVFQLVAVNASGTVKAKPITRSYDGWREQHKYEVFVWVPDGGSHYRPMTAAERAKVDAKTSTLLKMEERAVLLPKYKPKK